MSAQLSLRLDLWPDLFAHHPSALHLVAALGTAVFICNAREAREWARETIAGDNVREPHSFSWRSRARGTGQRCPRRLTGSQATGAARTAASSLSESSVPTRARRRIQALSPAPARTERRRKRIPSTKKKRFFWSLKCAPHCQCRPSGSSYSSLRMSMYVGHQRAVWVDISTDVCVSITD